MPIRKIRRKIIVRATRKLESEQSFIYAARRTFQTFKGKPYLLTFQKKTFKLSKGKKPFKLSKGKKPFKLLKGKILPFKLSKGKKHFKLSKGKILPCKLSKGKIQTTEILKNKNFIKININTVVCNFHNCVYFLTVHRQLNRWLCH